MARWILLWKKYWPDCWWKNLSDDEKRSWWNDRLYTQIRLFIQTIIKCTHCFFDGSECFFIVNVIEKLLLSFRGTKWRRIFLTWVRWKRKVIILSFWGAIATKNLTKIPHFVRNDILDFIIVRIFLIYIELTFFKIPRYARNDKLFVYFSDLLIYSLNITFCCIWKILLYFLHKKITVLLCIFSEAYEKLKICWNYYKFVI